MSAFDKLFYLVLLFSINVFSCKKSSVTSLHIQLCKILAGKEICSVSLNERCVYERRQYIIRGYFKVRNSKYYYLKIIILTFLCVETLDEKSEFARKDGRMDEQQMREFIKVNFITDL